jgi:hypothetical protein
MPWACFAIAAALAGCGGGSSSSPTSSSGPSSGGTTSASETPTVSRTWSGASLIENDDAGNLLAIEPKVAIDADGNSTAVWNQPLPNTPRIVSNRSSQSLGWGSAATINEPAYASHPEIASDGHGTAIAVWEQFDGIWSSRFTAGGGWGMPEAVSTPNVAGALSPRVSFARDGSAIAVWQQGDGSRTNIWSNHYTPGVGWGTPALIETNNDGDAQDPRMAVDPSGDALVVWRQTNAGGSTSIWSNYYKAGVGWDNPAPVENQNLIAAFPQVAFDGRGNALAVWSQWGSSGSDIWANHYTAGRGWGTAFLIETDDTGAAYSPQVAFDSQGNALVLWMQWGTVTRTGPCVVPTSAGGGSSCNPTTVPISNIWSRRYVAGSGWAQPELVETDDRGNASAPRFAFDEAGNAIAVWTQPNGRFVSVWANRYRNGTGWATATSLQDHDTGDAMTPAVAVNADGDAVAVWGQSDGLRANVWANRLH